MHGWIILDKPHGLGSTQAVSAVKRVLRQSGAGKVKVGHGGTLDPLATGVLPIAIGEATKLAGRMLELAEAEARGRGCHGAYIDTFNPQALKTYQRAGYTIFGSLPDFPKGRTRSFLSKPL